MNRPDPEKIKKLQAALEAYEAGEVVGAIFDSAAEEALSPVRQRAARLVAQRSRSRYELRQRLLGVEFAPELVDQVLDDLERSGVIDDAAFAHEWVRQRAARRGKSAKALNIELERKGVVEAERLAALEQITAADEERAARAAAEKKARCVKVIPSDRAEYDGHLRRIVGVMQRRGYSTELCMRVGREVLQTRLEELARG
ncbi:regulatory protein RecX [Corynebacterium mayonis]|uniref:regulatory protein RecX n=1 Tax=Corynebacterium mayonis TaxID=3062461 RepID=UPI003140113C